MKANVQKNQHKADIPYRFINPNKNYTEAENTQQPKYFSIHNQQTMVAEKNKKHIKASSKIEQNQIQNKKYGLLERVKSSKSIRSQDTSAFLKNSKIGILNNPIEEKLQFDVITKCRYISPEKNKQFFQGISSKNLIASVNSASLLVDNQLDVSRQNNNPKMRLSIAQKAQRFMDQQKQFYNQTKNSRQDIIKPLNGLSSHYSPILRAKNSQISSSFTFRQRVSLNNIKKLQLLQDQKIPQYLNISQRNKKCNQHKKNSQDQMLHRKMQELIQENKKLKKQRQNYQKINKQNMREIHQRLEQLISENNKFKEQRDEAIKHKNIAEHMLQKLRYQSNENLQQNIKLVQQNKKIKKTMTKLREHILKDSAGKENSNNTNQRKSLGIQGSFSSMKRRSSDYSQEMNLNFYKTPVCSPKRRIFGNNGEQSFFQLSPD